MRLEVCELGNISNVNPLVLVHLTILRHARLYEVMSRNMEAWYRLKALQAQSDHHQQTRLYTIVSDLSIFQHSPQRPTGIEEERSEGRLCILEVDLLVRLPQ